MLAKMLVKAGDKGLTRKELVTALLKANGKEWEPRRSGYGSIAFFTPNHLGVGGIYWEKTGDGRYRITEVGKKLVKTGVTPSNMDELRQLAYAREAEIMRPVLAANKARKTAKREKQVAKITKQTEPHLPTPQQRGKITEGQALREGFTIDNHTNPRIAYKGERFAPTEIHDITEIDGDLIAILFSVRKLTPREVRENGTENEKNAIDVFERFTKAINRKWAEGYQIYTLIRDIFTNW